MEATLFSAWIYDTLKPYTQQLSMGHPAKMKAITAGKKKSDSIDARTIADLLRCNCCPPAMCCRRSCAICAVCCVIANLVVRQSVRMQNKMAGLLMESGTPFDKEQISTGRILRRADEEPAGSTRIGQRSAEDESRLYGDVRVHAETVDQETALRSPLEQRVERLMSIDGVGPITALTWALEVADPHRFSSVADAVSYCGLTAAFRSSAGKQQRGPISKQRNAWLQTALIEAAKLAPRWNPQLAALHAQQLERGHANRATLQVARKLVAYLLAVDKSGQPFQVRTPPPPPNSEAENRAKSQSSRFASAA